MESEAHTRILTCISEGKVSTARELLEAVLVKQPADLDAINLLGTLDFEAGNTAAATNRFERVLQMDETHVGAMYNLGLCLQERGDQRAALEKFESVLDLHPSHEKSRYNAMLLNEALSQRDKARAHLDALLQSGDIEALAASMKTDVRVQLLCATFFLGCRRFPEALEVCNRIVNSGHRSTDAFCTRGEAFRSVGDLESARKDFHQAALLDPLSADALHNLASVLRVMGRSSEAIPIYERVLLIAAEARPDPQRFDRALCQLIWASREEVHWSNMDALRAQLIDRASSDNCSVDPRVVETLTDDLSLIEKSARAYWGRETQFRQAQTSSPDDLQKRKIRVGFISDVFSQNQTTHGLVALLNNLDSSEFETFGYCIGYHLPSAIRGKLRGLLGTFREFSGTGDDDASRQIIDDRLDLLIFATSGNASARRLLLTGPLAVRTASLPPTFGGLNAPTVDVILADEYLASGLESKAGAGGDRGKVMTIPRVSRLLARNVDIQIADSSRKTCGLPEDGVLFCAFHPLEYVNPSQFNLYLSILGEVPNSSLWLNESKFNLRARLREEAQKRGIDGQRLIFTTQVAYQDQIERLKHADLFLDNWPLTGSEWTCNALLAGLPVLAKTGNAVHSRLGASMLASLGQSGMIAASDVQYREIAVRLGNSPGELRSLKQKFEASRGSGELFDTAAFGRVAGTAFREIVLGRQNSSQSNGQGVQS